MSKKGNIRKYFGTDRAVVFNDYLSFKYCRRLPKELFSRVAFVQCMGGRSDMTTRMSFKEAQWLEVSNWYPCPTAEEFMVRMPGVTLDAPAGKRCNYIAEWIWGNGYNEYSDATGKTPVEALCKCFLKAYKEIKKKEKE